MENFFDGFKEKFKEQFVTILVSALTFVAAFAWRDAAQAGFESLGVANRQEFTAKLTYSIIVTVVAILVVYVLHSWVYNPDYPSK